jgi:murein L,D-transpeptidase YcbB/YkuD
MRSARFDKLLAGTAVALAFALAAPATAMAVEPGDQIEAGVPLPNLTPLPPPTLSDLGPPQGSDRAGPTGSVTDAKSIEAAVPLPDLTPLSPVTIKDLGQTLHPEPTRTATAPAAEQPTNAAESPESGPAKDVEVPGQAPAKAADTPATAMPGIDVAVAEKLRAIADGKFDRMLRGKKERASVESFYEARGFAPLWITDGVVNARGKAAIKYLGGVYADGLDPIDYPAPNFAAASGPDALADAEMRLTASVLTFAHHAQIGRIHYTRVAGDIAFKLERSEPAEVLRKIAEADDAGKALDSFNPQQPGYKALKAALAKARKGPTGPTAERVQVAEGPILRPGMSDERVISVRKRLNIPGDRDSPLYDDAVFEAVKDFQRRADIADDGLLGRMTVRALNGHHRASADPVATIVANMERWRWLPHQLGNPYVMVNIPDYTLRVVRDGKTIWRTKIVVGKPNLRTPLTSADMKYITVNPTWNVPPSIVRNEYLPALREDPHALERIGLKLEQNRDGTLHVYQPPGDSNALGRIRFNFPNKFLVYQHDTPQKHLFEREKRAYSHGCMRVQNPLEYGEVLLSLVMPEKHYTVDKLRKMFGGSEININLPKPIPVHLTYQTAYVDDAGKLVIRDDVYGFDSTILAILHGDQRKVADTPIERHDNNTSQPVTMPEARSGGSSSRGAYGATGPYGGGYVYQREPSFFERLFGFVPEPSPPPRQMRYPRRQSARDSGWN